MEILLNIWWKSLHRNSRYCQNHQNGVTSCFPKMVIKMKKKIVLNHQNIGCKRLLGKGEKNRKFETWPFTHYQTRSGILNHCAIPQNSFLVGLALFFAVSFRPLWTFKDQCKVEWSLDDFLRYAEMIYFLKSKHFSYNE